MVKTDQDLRSEQLYRPALGRSRRPLALGLGAALVVLLLLVTLPPAATAWTTRLRERLSTQIQTFEALRSQIENDVQRAGNGSILLRRRASCRVWR